MPAAILPTEAQTIRKYATSFKIYGILLVVLGILAIIAPGLATIAATTLLGWLLLVSGVFGLIAVFSAGAAAPGFWWNLLSSVLFVLAAMALLWNPVAGALTLTIILAAYLIATGITKIALAIGYRRSIPRAWIWMLLSAAVDILLGALIISGFPGDALWILGLMIGINLLFTGSAVVAAAVYCRDIVSDAA